MDWSEGGGAGDGKAPSRSGKQTSAKSAWTDRLVSGDQGTYLPCEHVEGSVERRVMMPCTNCCRGWHGQGFAQQAITEHRRCTQEPARNGLGNPQCYYDRLGRGSLRFAGRQDDAPGNGNAGVFHCLFWSPRCLLAALPLSASRAALWLCCSLHAVQLGVQQTACQTTSRGTRSAK